VAVRFLSISTIAVKILCLDDYFVVWGVLFEY
jgi:hypothetical protein